MVRSSQASSYTFSGSPYFDDRGSHGYAEPITERVNVSTCLRARMVWCLTYYLAAAFSTHRFILLPQGHRSSTLRSTYSYYGLELSSKLAADSPSQEHHPMKPHRLTLTNALVLGYGLDKQIHNIYNPRPATQAELEAYHSHDYIDFLSR